MSLKEVFGLRSDYLVDSNQAVEFKLVRKPEDIRDPRCFKPEMSYQIFGDDEQIYGYKNLRIKLYYSAANLHIYLSVEYDDRLPDAIPTNLEKVLADKYEYRNFVTNSSEFEKLLNTEKDFMPHGTLLNSFSITRKNVKRNFEIYKCTTDTKKFLNYHARMQTFVIWYIDAASFIDTEDANWKFFVLYEKYTSANNTLQYALTGYFTVYEYYSYPDKIRPRISQAMILPPFQNIGLCAKLIGTMQMHYASLKEVYDITVEDPAQNFQRVRDYVDCSKCLNLLSFEKGKLKTGFSPEMVEEARIKYRINKKQVRRVYEILRLNATNIHNEEEFRLYRLDVKKRLNAPFLRQQLVMKKCNQMHLLESNEDRVKKLQDLFQELMEEYTKVVVRVSEHPFES